MIRRTLPVVLVVLALAVTPALAGGDHCKGSPEDCVKKIHAKLSAKGWLGVETEKAADGRYQVTVVVPGSPAEAAGFRPGDLLVAMNGVELNEANKEAISKVKHSLGPGSQVTYTVKRQGGKVELAATLSEMPRAQIAQYIGEHMLDQHVEIRMAAK